MPLRPNTSSISILPEIRAALDSHAEQQGQRRDDDQHHRDGGDRGSTLSRKPIHIRRGRVIASTLVMNSGRRSPPRTARRPAGPLFATPKAMLGRMTDDPLDETGAEPTRGEVDPLGFTAASGSAPSPPQQASASPQAIVTPMKVSKRWSGDRHAGHAGNERHCRRRRGTIIGMRLRSPTKHARSAAAASRCRARSWSRAP